MAQDWQAYLDAIPDDLLSVDEKFQAEAHILHTIANVEDRIRLFRGEHAMQAGRIKALLPSAGARAAAASPGWWPRTDHACWRIDGQGRFLPQSCPSMLPVIEFPHFQSMRIHTTALSPCLSPTLVVLTLLPLMPWSFTAPHGVTSFLLALAPECSDGSKRGWKVG